MALGGPAAFITADLATREKVEVREFEGRKYTLIHRTSGAIEIFPHSDRSMTWYDTNGDGQLVEYGIAYYGRFMAPLNYPEFIESASRIYQGLLAKESQCQKVPTTKFS